MKSRCRRIAAGIATGVSMLILVGVVTASLVQVSGTVTNQTGEPCSGTAVEVLNPGNGTIVASATTDSSGYYTLAVAAGTYNVRVTPPAGSGFQTSIALNRIISDNRVLDFVLVPSGVAGLSGRIQDRFGNGLGGLQLYLLATAGDISINVATDNTGAYAFQVAPGDYMLRMSVNDYAAAFNAPRYFYLNASEFTLSASTIADITIPAHRVIVHVQDPAGNPVANTAINSNSPNIPGLSIGPFSGYGNSGYPTWLPAAVTGADGDAVMWLFPNGPDYPGSTYTLTATPPSGSPLATTNVSGVSIASDTSVTITLATPVTLSGRIQDRFGNGLWGQHLYLSASGGGSATNVATDNTGAYAFQVAPGDYRLVIDGRDDAAAFNAPRYFDLWTSEITLSASTVADITIPARRVTVHVQDPVGHPVANTAINTRGANASRLSVGPFSGWGYSAYPAGKPPAATDAGGDAVMWLLPSDPNPNYGTYTLTATPPSGSPLAITNVSGVSIASDTSLTITLATPVTLSGQIQDRLGNGLGGLQLYLAAIGGGSATNVATGHTGAYAFQAAPGDYILEIYGMDYEAAFNAPRYFNLYSSGFTLSASTIADITIPAHRVTVRVQDPAGNPVANTAINSNSPNIPGMSIGPFSGYGDSGYPTWLPAAVTGAGGDAVMWLFPNDASNAYTLTATPPSGSPFVTFNISNVSVSSDKDIVVVLQFVHDSPVTTANLSPSPDGNGEYSNPATVTLSATAFSGFTVAATYYSVDGGSTQIYAGPFIVSGAGPHTIWYWSVDNSGVLEIPNTRTFTINARQQAALGTAGIWLGLKNSDDVGTKFDLLAEVFKNGELVGSGQLDGVAGGSSGFNNAVLRTINLALSSPVNLPAGEALSIRLSVRIAVGVSGHRSGTARLWFNDEAAGSRFGATMAGATNYFLRDGFALSTTAGPGPKKTIDVFVDRLVGGNPFKPFGTWSKTF